MFGGTAAAPAEGPRDLPEPDLNRLALLPPDPAELMAGILRANIGLIDDLAPDRYQMLVARAAHRHRLDARLIASVITVETRWDETAVGSHGERGLMQILPSTGAWLAQKAGLDQYDLSDPETSIELGSYYLAMLLAEYGSPEKALAAYNGGPGAAQHSEENPYMLRVMKVYNLRPPAPKVAPIPDPIRLPFALAS